MPLKLPAQLSALRKEERHPVAAGVIALASVAVALGLLAGLFTLAAAGVFGLGGGSRQEAQAVDQGASLYLPSPRPTASRSGALITLSPLPITGEETTAPADPTTETPAQEIPKISLQAGRSTVGSMERIDLSGVYTGGEGAVLQVQRKEDGAWADFRVTVGVSGDRFSTYVQTGHTGAQKWRVIDTDTKLASNVVTVTVG